MQFIEPGHMVFLQWRVRLYHHLPACMHVSGCDKNEIKSVSDKNENKSVSSVIKRYS